MNKIQTKREQNKLHGQSSLDASNQSLKKKQKESNEQNTKLIVNKNQFNNRKNNNLKNKDDSCKNNKSVIINHEDKRFNNISTHTIDATTKKQKKEIIVQQKHLIVIKTKNQNRLACLNESKDNPYNNKNNYNTIQTDKITNSSASRYNKTSIITKPQQKQMSFKTYILTNTNEIRKGNNLNNNNIKRSFPKNYDSKNKKYFNSEAIK